MPIDGFLKIDGINGECKDADHEDWINVTNFRWGMTQEALPAPDGKLAAGTPTVQSAQFMQPLSRASPRLYNALYEGNEIASMILEGTLPHGDEKFVYMRAEFKDCLITGIETSGTGTEYLEEVEVVFRSVNIQTKERPS